MAIDEIIHSLESLPPPFIDKAYFLDVIGKTVRLQFDSFLLHFFEGKRTCPNPSNPDFIYFRFGDWTVIMEKEEDH